MIDLRSDTFTVPTEDMRRHLSQAPVGDDVFGEDPSINELQDYTADLLGKEAGLYVPSGVMANQISLAVLTNPGDEVIVESDAHIFYYEAASPSVISGVQLRCIPSKRGMMPEDKVLDAIRPPDHHFPPTSLICIENTHNRHGGAVIEIDYIHRLENIVKDHNFNFHCDGARLWEASSATKISMADYAKPFDTVSVCLSKGLGAPVGSVIVSSKDNITEAHRWRKILGGGMRQAGIIASAGLYAIKNNVEKLPYTHDNARTFAKLLYESEYIDVKLENIETNIVVFRHNENLNSGEIERLCHENGVQILAIGNNTMRAVFHFQIDKSESVKAAEIIKDMLNKFNK